MTTAQLKARGLTKHPGGRPSVKTPETCQKLLEVVRTGLPLKFAAATVGISYEALNQWREKDPEILALQAEREALEMRKEQKP